MYDLFKKSISQTKSFSLKGFSLKICEFLLLSLEEAKAEK